MASSTTRSVELRQGTNEAGVHRRVRDLLDRALQLMNVSDLGLSNDLGRLVS